MPRINSHSHTTMPRRTNIFYALLGKNGELSSYVANPEQVEHGYDPVLRVCRHTYDSLHAEGYFVDLEHRIACRDLSQLYKYCQKITPVARFNGNYITKSKKLTREEKEESIREEEEERRRADEYFQNRGRTNGKSLADHLDHLLPNSRK